ncbi:MAG: hypothetical protein LBH25_05345 [Fibromonadaceae bacterium]|jgi:hypothetical protein|nr:hypothetical protein [Fibromonadaceae bacterium]
MKNAIQEIIKKVPKGKIFDSHYVINQLISDYSDEYLAFASSVAGSKKKTNTVHRLIGEEIKKFSDLIEQVGEVGDFWSDNIRGNASVCTGWRKK